MVKTNGDTVGDTVGEGVSVVLPLTVGDIVGDRDTVGDDEGVSVGLPLTVGDIVGDRDTVGDDEGVSVELPLTVGDTVGEEVSATWLLTCTSRITSAKKSNCMAIGQSNLFYFPSLVEMDLFVESGVRN